MRNYNQEFQDNSRQYAYTFDTLLRRYMMRTFSPMLPTGRALELGCFQGDFTELIVPHFATLCVVDASDKLLQMTRKRIGEQAQYVCGTFETVNIQEQFDAIFLIHTLEHCEQPVFVLERIKSWLREDGLLFLAVPNATAASRQLAVAMGLIAHNCAVTDAEYEHGHRQTYSFDTLARDIKAAGLGIEQQGGVFFKALANFQLDNALASGIITPEYMDACYQLGMQYPELCASIYMICSKRS